MKNKNYETIVYNKEKIDKRRWKSQVFYKKLKEMVKILTNKEKLK